MEQIAQWMAQHAVFFDKYANYVLIPLLLLVFALDWKVAKSKLSAVKKKFIRYGLTILAIIFGTLVFLTNFSFKPMIKAMSEVDQAMGTQMVQFEYLNIDSGQSESLEKHKGKVVLLNFWGTFCPPCIKEFPDLKKLEETYPNEVVVVAISNEEPEKIKDFIAKVDRPSVVGYQENYSWINPEKFLPVTIVIKDGIITQKLFGRKTFVEFAEIIDAPAKVKSEVFNKLIWSDEFNGEGAVDSDKWFLQTQLPPGGSWWGGIIQHYTDREANTYMKDGYLNLVAKKEAFEDQGELKQYTAARMNSKFAFTYGRVEVRAKLPTGKGTWPAIWMLNTNIDEDGAWWDNEGYGKTKWPNCGEIDIMEHWGKNQDYVSSAVHNGSSYGYNVENVGGQKIENASTEFHIYSLEWTEDYMVFSVDGKQHMRYEPAVKNANTWPYDSDYYFLLNIAIEPDIDPEFTESPMVVDYIRVYQ